MLTRANEALERRRKLSAWVAREVMPHEGAVRAWLARSRVSPEDSEDMIQEAYCALAALDTRPSGLG